nr:hypothetical protein [Tanacetum cinerariifolium]
MSILKMLLLVMMLMEMILLLMEKFLLLLKNHPYHLLPYLLYYHNHLKISLQHLRYNKLYHNHLRRVEHLEYDKVAQALEITKLKRRVKKLKKENKGRMIAEMDNDDAVVLMDDKEEDKKVEEAKEDETEPAEVQEVVDFVTTTKLITEVVTAASETATAASAIIPTAEPQVPAATLSAAPARVVASPTRRRKGVVIRDSEEESTTSTIIPETKSKDKGKGILVEEPKPLKKKQQIEMDEEYARKLHVELNKDIDWDVAIDHVKLKAKEDPVEVEDLKRHLEIVPDEDDDVYTEATPLARKMLNAVRLQVEEESEVSLELLRFTRQQHQEGQLQ